MKEFNAKNGTSCLTKVNDWKQKLIQEFHQRVKDIPQSLRDKLIARADQQLNNSWPTITALDYLEFTIDGDRYNFEEKSFARRVHLADLAIGELLTNNSKYMNQLVNGLWILLEESTWVQPAHINNLKGGDGLADVSDPVVDIIAPEPALLVVWIKLLLRKILYQLFHMDLVIS